MEFILEALGYILSEIILGIFLLYPGASVLWLLSRGNKSLKSITEKERTKSFAVSLSLIIVGLILFV